jgi:SOS-response transcriptional repressor LexA
MKTIGQRISELRIEQKISRPELADAIGVSDVTVGNWERDLNLPIGKNLVALAKKLKTSTEWLVLMQGNKYLEKPKLKNLDSMLLPVISLTTAKHWQPGNQLKLGDAEDWRATTANVSDSAFIIRPEGDAMLSPGGSPPISEHAFVIVDPEIAPTDGSIALIAFSNSNKTTLKKLVIDGPNHYLKSLNPQYKTIPIDETCTVIGTVKRVEFDL